MSYRNILIGIEKSFKQAAVSILIDGEIEDILIDERTTNRGYGNLLYLVKQLQSKYQFDLSDISKIFVATGPGSFTGIRIGIATGLGLALGAKLKVCGVSTFDAIVAGYDHKFPHNKNIFIVLKSRKDELYIASFRSDFENQPLTRIAKDRLIDIAELETIKKSYDNLIVTDPTLLDELGYTKKIYILQFLPIDISRYIARGLVIIGHKGYNTTAGFGENLVPNYLAKSQAELKKS